MARRITKNSGFTPAGVADTTAFTSGQTFAMYRGGSATQYTRFWEFSFSGLASSTSSPTPMVFADDSAISVGALTFAAGGGDSYMSPFTAALAAPLNVGNIAATTYSQRDASNHKMQCGLNAFGGVYFWRGNRAEECPALYGTAVSLGDMSVSCFTGGTPGLISGHVIYETD